MQAAVELCLWLLRENQHVRIYYFGFVISDAFYLLTLYDLEINTVDHMNTWI